ncbi:hypothetical protein V4890_18605 [Ralstonia solanacearum species complex bacterium KE056]|uniref:hypothetical protein n=1 Tax=Ralstonia solanacearum species complex bacterium KE056 TaxID=3119585 RepID=UPI002FC28FB8
MKNKYYFLCGCALIYITCAIWSIFWIDSKSTSDLPGRCSLAVARLFWSITPAIDQNKDADRALKLSWLSASTDINRKEKKTISKIVETLSTEFSFVADYTKSNNQALSEEMRTRAATLLLTYLNRVELYQTHPNEPLEKKLEEFASGIARTTPETQENWYRETMIRSYLKGEYDLYTKNREALSEVFRRYGQNIPADFKEGALSFYDGVLLCIRKKSEDASAPLQIANKNFSKHPRLAINFFLQDLNVLLLGRGMESGKDCNDHLTSVIYSGA